MPKCEYTQTSLNPKTETHSQLTLKALHPKPKTQTSRGGADGHQRRPIADSQVVRREASHTRRPRFEAQDPIIEPSRVVARLRSANHCDDQQVDRDGLAQGEGTRPRGCGLQNRVCR